MNAREFENTAGGKIKITNFEEKRFLSRFHPIGFPKQESAHLGVGSRKLELLLKIKLKFISIRTCYLTKISTISNNHCFCFHE